MSDQLQALATLTPEKEPRYRVNRRLGWAPEAVYVFCRREKSLVFDGHWITSHR